MVASTRSLRAAGSPPRRARVWWHPGRSTVPIASLCGGGETGVGHARLVIWSRSDARRRIGTLIGLALLIALAGGATLASLAGARRSATAYQRLRVRTMAMDAAVFGDPATVRATRSPSQHVAASSPFAIAGIFARDNHDLFPFVEPGSDAIGRTIERPLILAGRRAHQDDPFEIVLPEGAGPTAAQEGRRHDAVRVGPGRGHRRRARTATRGSRARASRSGSSASRGRRRVSPCATRTSSSCSSPVRG